MLDTDYLAFFYLETFLIATKVVFAIVVNMGWIMYPVKGCTNPLYWYEKLR